MMWTQGRLLYTVLYRDKTSLVASTVSVADIQLSTYQVDTPLKQLRQLGKIKHGKGANSARLIESGYRPAH